MLSNLPLLWLWSYVEIPDGHAKKTCQEYVSDYCATQDQHFVVWLLAAEDKAGRLTSIIYNILKNVEDARDVAQDIFEMLKDRLNNSQPTVNCSAWLRKIVRNKAIDFSGGKAVRREKEKKADWLEERDDPSAITELKIRAEKILIKMRSDLAGIEKGWEIVILKNKGEKFIDCANKLGLTFTQFRGRYQRADKKLRENHGGDYPKYLVFAPEFSAKEIDK